MFFNRQKIRKKRLLRAFNKAVKGFIKANENNEKQRLKRLLELMPNMPENKDIAEIFPDFRIATGAIVFSEEETTEFSEPFNLLFSACDRVARVIKRERAGAGYTYEIKFARFGFNVTSGERASILQAKESFKAAAKGGDEICN